MKLRLFGDPVVELEGWRLHGRCAGGRLQRGKDVELAVMVFDRLRVVGKKRRASLCRRAQRGR